MSGSCRVLSSTVEVTSGYCLNLPHTKYGFTIHFGRSQGDILAYVAPVQRSDRQGNSLTKRYNQSLNCHRLHSGPPRTQYVHTHTLPILCMPYPSLRSPGDILRERAPVLSCDRQDNSITKRFAQSCNSHRVHQQPQAATTHSHLRFPYLGCESGRSQRTEGREADSL